MQNLGKTLEKISVVLQNKKFRPLFRIHSGRISTSNGTLSASALFDEPGFPPNPIVIDAEVFCRVWSDGAFAEIDGGVLRIKSRHTTYTLRILDDVIDLPQFIDRTHQLDEKQRDGILIAAQFAATGDAQPWAKGVTIRNGDAIATNNISLICVQTGIKISDCSIPEWAIKALHIPGDPPKIGVSERGVVFEFSDGAIIQSAPLAEEPPAALANILISLQDVDIPCDELADSMKDLTKVKSQRMTLDPENRLVTATSEDGDRAEAVVPLGETHKSVTVQVGVMKTVLKHATHIGFENAPAKLMFSSDKAPSFRGVVAGMS